MSGMLGGGAGPQDGGEAPAPDHGPMGTQLAAQFAKTTQAMKTVDDVRAGLTKLVGMGAAITPEDVIKEAGVLVGKGQDPVALAGLMADMPTNGGDALASWVAMHAQQAERNERQIGMMHTVARHNLGVHSIHQLARNAISPVPAAQPGGALGQLAPKGTT